MFGFLKNIASFSVPSWVSIAAVIAVIGGYTAWIMYRQHEIDGITLNAEREQHQRFVDQVKGIGEAARAANARIAAENAAKLAKMENDHAKRELQIKADSADSEKRNSNLVASLRLRLAVPGDSGSGPGAGAPATAEGAGGIECYNAGDLQRGVRGSLDRFLARASSLVRRSEEAESLVELCRTFAAGFAPISPPLK